MSGWHQSSSRLQANEVNRRISLKQLLGMQLGSWADSTGHKFDLPPAWRVEELCRFKDLGALGSDALMFLEKVTLCIGSCLPCQCVPPCACRLVPTLHRSARPGNLKLKEAPWGNTPCAETNTHTDCRLALAWMLVRMAAALTTVRHGALIATLMPTL